MLTMVFSPNQTLNQWKTWDIAKEIGLRPLTLTFLSVHAWEAKFGVKHFKILKETALTPLMKVLENEKSHNFDFVKFWTYMEEIEENWIGNSQIQNKHRNSEKLTFVF